MIRFYKSAPNNAGFLAAINFSCYKGKGRFWIDLVGQTGYEKEKRVPTFKGSSKRIKLSLNEGEAASFLRVLRKKAKSFPSNGKPAYHSTNKGTTMFSLNWYEDKHGGKGVGLSVTQKNSDTNVTIKSWFNEDEAVLLEEYLVAGLHKFFLTMMDEEKEKIISSYKKSNEQHGSQQFSDPFAPPSQVSTNEESSGGDSLEDDWDHISEGNVQDTSDTPF